MDAATFDRSVIDYAAAVFLRYFSAAQHLSMDQPSLIMRRDRELLRLHWALSKPVLELVEYMLANRHEVQSLLGSKLRVEDGALRGRLDAIKTLKLRRTSGLETALVGNEPIRSYSSGANHILGWVITEAWAMASRFSVITFNSVGYRESIDRALQRLDQCRRLQSFTQLADSNVLSKRPTTATLLQASRSRRLLYHKATDAYRYLLKVESGDPETITAMLCETMLGPLEPWRRFELAVGLSAAEALAAAQRKPLTLNLLIGETRSHLAQSGDFQVSWQSRTEHYRAPELEPSEAKVQNILAAYGVSEGADRPDLVITSFARNAAVAIIEVKYLTSEDATDRLKDAVNQLVRYSRGYSQSNDFHRLLGSSVAVMSQGIANLVRTEVPPGVPSLVDFVGITKAALLPWAEKLCAE